MIQTKIAHILQSYRTHFFPHPILKHDIAHYTVLIPEYEPTQLAATTTLIPDASGCIVITISQNEFEAKFWGPTTKTVEVNNHKKNYLMYLFVEFLPTGSYHLLDLPQKDIVDLQVSLNQINESLYTEIYDIVMSSDDIIDLINALDALFIQYLSKNNVLSNLQPILTYIHQSHHILTVKEISKHVSYSERQLNRYFNHALGMNIKKYTKILRINRATQMMQNNLSLTTISHTLGYFDQAHFTHDFKSITNITPTQYLKNLSDFYNESFKF